MAYENRDYFRQEEQRFSGPRMGGFGRGLSGHSVVTWLLIANVAVFVWQSIFGTAMRGGFLAPYPWGHFSVEKAIHGGQVWRFFTYQFLHADFFHILFNMIGLYFFGPLMERWWGSRRFLVFYLLCGVGGALVATLLGLVPGLLVFPPGSPLVGASGAVFGILAGCAVCFPHERVHLIFPPIELSMRTVALVFLGIAALSVIAGSANAGGDAAHLGGALLGFVLVKAPRSLGWAEGSSSGGGSGPSLGQRVREAKQRRRRQNEQDREAEVDRILAKVREQGLQSLTRREKKTLAEETKAKQRGG